MSIVVCNYKMSLNAVVVVIVVCCFSVFSVIWYKGTYCYSGSPGSGLMCFYWSDVMCGGVCDV